MAACDPSVYRITLVHVICEIILSKIVATLFDLWVKGLLADASDFFIGKNSGFQWIIDHCNGGFNWVE